MSQPLSKQDIRRIMLAQLRALAPALRSTQSAILRQKLRARLLRPDSLVVGLYAPMPHEVDLMPLLREHPRHRYAFPRCQPGRRLRFHLVEDPDHGLAPGIHGILEPKPELPVIEPQEIDLLLIPGLAFTASGSRLGYGGGYYDRYMPLCTKAQRIALAFREQILPDLPTEPHDIAIPLLLTP